MLPGCGKYLFTLIGDGADGSFKISSELKLFLSHRCLQISITAGVGASTGLQIRAPGPQRPESESARCQSEKKSPRRMLLRDTLTTWVELERKTCEEGPTSVPVRTKALMTHPAKHYVMSGGGQLAVARTPLCLIFCIRVVPIKNAAPTGYFPHQIFIASSRLDSSV